MNTGSKNVTVITKEDNSNPVKDLARVEYSSACQSSSEIPTPPVPQPVSYKHNDLEEIQGGDVQNRYHLDLVRYKALLAAPNPSLSNRYLVLTDLATVVTNETDPTVPSYVKAITQEDISYWDSSLHFESDPTVPSHVKSIRIEDISRWNSALQTESDPTVPAIVKTITQEDIDRWNTRDAPLFELITDQDGLVIV